ncbi:DUF6482 family protein [Nitrincola tapanii]|uniref:Uncharacterized protein n=1 Tax=Nitrincola tapanii TaxID=1708751 RepID=A0A5A9W547_9GAMM|nr:DUF6482 family protein [Nitrincola tapanii]KAA0875896.1 hypothetical protein E1H14_04200 [Nitrincola tapanii]
MKVSLHEVQKGQLAIERLILRSFECEIYLVSIEEKTRGELIVCDPQGSPLSFRSQLDAKKPFKGLGITRTELHHQSPYNEMIGIAVNPVEPMQVKIANPDQDYS